jgi:hypothetical protein
MATSGLRRRALYLVTEERGVRGREPCPCPFPSTRPVPRLIVVRI